LTLWVGIVPFSRLLAIFSEFSYTFIFNAPAEGFPLKLCNGGGLQKNK